MTAMNATDQTKRIAARQSRYDSYLMALPNVVGTAIGYRQRGGAQTKELCLVVMVRRKCAPADLPADEIVPRELDGIPLDVIETGGFSA